MNYPKEYQQGFRYVRNFLRIFIITFIAMSLLFMIFILLFTKSVTVEAVGMIEPKVYINIKSEITGIIEDVFVREGDRVRKGDLLATIVDTEIEVELQKAIKDLEISQAELIQAQYQLKMTEIETANRIREAEANVRLARADLERSMNQYKLSLSTYKDVVKNTTNTNKVVDEFPEIEMKQAQLQRAEALLEAAKGDSIKVDVQQAKIITIERKIKKLKENVRLYRDKLRKTKIYAPAAGVVLTHELEKKVGDRILEGEILLQLGDLSSWSLRTIVREEDIPKIKPNQAVKIYVKAFPFMEYRILEGKVEKLPFSPILDDKGQIQRDKNGRIFYEVIVDIDDPSLKSTNNIFSLRYGLGAKAKIVIGKKRIIRYLQEKFFKVAGKMGETGI